MGSVPVSILNSLVDEVAGPGGAWWVVSDNPDPRSPIAVLLEEGMRGVSRDVLVYWVDGGMPSNYAWPGFTPAAIAFSTRFLEVGATMYRLLNATYLDGEQLVRASERLSLQVLAELVLKGGDPATAVYLMTRSLGSGGGVVFPMSTLETLESEPIGEGYMAVWFFALAHELGHVFAKDDKSGPVLSDEELARRVELVISAFPVPEGSARAWRQSLTSGDDRALWPAKLQEEIKADVYGVDALWRATQEMMARIAVPLDSVEFCVSVFKMFTILGQLNMLSHAAYRATNPRTPGSDDDPGKNVAASVRAGVVIESLAELTAAHSVSAGDIDSRQRWADLLAEAAQSDRQRTSEVESGVARAMRQAYWPAERDLDVAERLHEEALTNSFLRVEVAAFLQLADDLGVNHDDINWLGAVASRQTDEAGAHVYYAVWVGRPDGSGEPFAVDSRFGWLVFIFVEQGELYATFKSASEPGLNAEYRLEDVALPCHHEWEVPIRVARAVWEAEHRKRCRVLIQGTVAFDDMMKRLAVGKY